MMINIKKASYYEAKIYIGSREQYYGEGFSLQDLKDRISDFQKDNIREKIIPVRITSTSYLAGDYCEQGWEISVINYPRTPREHYVLEAFAMQLAQYLLKKFHRNRISVVCPDKIVMFEAEDAMEKA